MPDDQPPTGVTDAPDRGVPDVPRHPRCHNAPVPDSLPPDSVTPESPESSESYGAEPPEPDIAALTIPAQSGNEPLSSSAVYVAAPEGDTGKSTVAE